MKKIKKILTVIKHFTEFYTFLHISCIMNIFCPTKKKVDICSVHNHRLTFRHRTVQYEEKYK